MNIALVRRITEFERLRESQGEREASEGNNDDHKAKKGPNEGSDGVRKKED